MRSRREIREDLAAELGSDAPAPERVAKLTAELEAARRVWRRRRRDTAARSADSAPALRRDLTPPRGLTEQDQAAIETWPPDLRGRLRFASMSRVIDRASSVHDPENWGARP